MQRNSLPHLLMERRKKKHPVPMHPLRKPQEAGPPSAHQKEQPKEPKQTGKNQKPESPIKNRKTPCQTEEPPPSITIRERIVYRIVMAKKRFIQLFCLYRVPFDSQGPWPVPGIHLCFHAALHAIFSFNVSDIQLYHFVQSPIRSLSV